MEPIKSVEAPKCCPACQSVNVVTTSKIVDTAAYWRCRRCGEVWNVSRRANGSIGYRRAHR